MKKLSLLFCLTIITCIVSAQNTKRYEGKMRLPSDLEQFESIFNLGKDLDLEKVAIQMLFGAEKVEGDGYYNYYENSDGERIKHGKFYLRAQGYDINGTYSHGNKTGKWSIDNIRDDNGKDISNKRHIYINMTFVNDTLNGSCEFSRNTHRIIYDNMFLDEKTINNIIDGKTKINSVTRINGKTIVDIINGSLTIECNFENGKLKGSISKTIYQWVDNSLHQTKYQANIDKNGFLDGIVTITEKGGIEKLHKCMYYNGALVSIETIDYSTGEKKLGFCAFNNLKKAPNLNQIKDTIKNGYKYITYNGQFAKKTKDDDHEILIIWLPINSILITAQLEKWNYCYSENEYGKQEARIADSIHKREIEIANKIKERERFVADSIQKAKREQSKLAKAKFENYILSIKRKHIEITENRMNPGLKPYTLKVVNTNGKIKKCNNNGEITFTIDKESVGGEFSKDYVKTDANEVYNQTYSGGYKIDDDGFTNEPFSSIKEISTEKYELLSTEDGSILIYKYTVYINQEVMLLIVKDGPKKGVYEITPSAQKYL